MKRIRKGLACFLSICLLMSTPMASVNAAEIPVISSGDIGEMVILDDMDVSAADVSVSDVSASDASVSVVSEGDICESEVLESVVPQNMVQSVATVFVNPLYEDQVSEDTLAQWEAELAEKKEVHASTMSPTATSTAYTPEEAVAAITEAMVDREAAMTISVVLSEMPDDVGDYGIDLIHEAYADDATADADEGDYLRYHYAGGGLSASWIPGTEKVTVTYEYTFYYWSTAAQEQAVTAKLTEVYAELNLGVTSGEGRIGKIYDYITNHVTYDYEHLNLGAQQYPTAWTAYGGLIDGTCVCQGYSTLTYRMMKESGVPVRVISGDAGGGHAWNIVGIDGLYYNIDSTWDGYVANDDGSVAMEGQRNWYLLSMADFGSHTRDDEYLTAAFQTEHPMAAKSYGAVDSDEMLEEDNLSYTFTTADGGSVSTTAASGECTILVFGRVTCGYTQNYTEMLRDSGILSSQKVRGILVDIDQEMSSVQAYNTELACDDIAVCCGAEGNGISAMWAYCSAGGHSGSVSFPLVVVIDGNNKIRHMEVCAISLSGVKKCLGQLLDYKAPVISSAEVTAKGVELTWSAVEDAEKYHVYCSVKEGAEFIKVASVTDTTYTYVLPAEGSYIFGVSMESGNIESPMSDTVSVSYQQGAVKEVCLSQTEVSLFTYQETMLTATVEPEMAGDEVSQAVIWESQDESIVTVEAGKLTGVRPGTTTVTATSEKDNTKKASCAVTVKEDYRITYELNGGTLNESNPSVYNPYYPALALNEPVKAECNFLGWYRDADFAEDTRMENIPAGSDFGDFKLHAKWKEIATVSTPVASIASGEVEKGTKVKLSCDTLDAEIYYTVDGTNPDRSSNRYVDVIVVNEAVEIRAFAVKNGYRDSETAVFYYTVKDDTQDLGDVRPEDVPEDGVIPTGLWMAGVEDVVYSGDAVTFDLRVYDGKKLLTLKTDYTVSYKNNKAAAKATDKKAPTVTVTGKGNYKDKVQKTFTINPLSIQGAEFTWDTVAKAYNGKEQKPVPVLYRDGVKLKAKKDYKVIDYPETEEGAYVEPGTYRIVLEGCGNYCDSIEATVTITKAALMSKAKISTIPAQPYHDGNAVEPAVTVKMGKNIVDSSMYTVKYVNNYNVGTATVRVEGDGVNYVGVKTATFKITGVAMSKVKIENFEKSLPYTGKAVTQDKVKLTYTAKKGEEPQELNENRDYTVTYTKNENAGTATVVFKGIGRYTGSIKKTYKITPYNIEEDEDDLFEVSYEESVPYAKGGCKPAVQVYFDGTELKAGKDYTLSYKNNKALNDGTNPKKLATVVVKGKGSFKGSVDCVFKITKQDIALMKVQVADKLVSNKANAYKSVPKVYDVDGKQLKAGTDYEKAMVYYYDEDTYLADNSFRASGTVIDSRDVLLAGTVVRVEITGKGNYEDNTLCGKYRIIKADISKASVKVDPQVYTGSPVEPSKDQIHITLKGEEVPSENYEIVSCSNNTKKGTATMVLRGVGEYGGTKTVKFSIGAKTVKDAEFLSIVQ